MIGIIENLIEKGSKSIDIEDQNNSMQSKTRFKGRKSSEESLQKLWDDYLPTGSNVTPQKEVGEDHAVQEKAHKKSKESS